ncbi:hypothetical protein BCR37DRAFT_48316 [Protomyces lactucae-debilis]|uniref:Uncharacterized protein n=1 Tax=Protomyces lactucae-debilis TaxID=2754530 RepID=A0A1Y2FCF7_PROLT|nr:uncharacterized protein BCR37DRAFT_48316 [Protomyces lactucae-debilis]ORY81609.1 hypothetical protein BCR37DRAFT_48316 [Protomyces lactucae-debilis]
MASRLPGEISSSRPLRCTSLHQSISASAESPATPAASRLSQSAPSDNILEPGATFSDVESDSDRSLSDESIEQDLEINGASDLAVEVPRLQVRDSRHRRRRLSSASGAKLRSNRLSLAYTSPKTTAEAMSIFNSRKVLDGTLGSPLESAEHRKNFLAELPSAIAHVRNVNYRRGALLPRPKSFTRVQQSLSEETSPVDTDAQKEAKLANILRGKEHALKAQEDMDSMIEDMTASRDTNTTKGAQPTGLSAARGPNSLMDILATPIQEEDVFTFDDLSPRLGLPTPLSPLQDDKEQGLKSHKKRKNSEDARFER